MATAPKFTTTPRIGFGSVTAANTGRDGTGTIVDILTGASSGTKITSIVVKATGDPADSIVTIFIYDGTGYRLYDEVDLADPAAASTTVPGYRSIKSYEDLILPSASYKLAAAITVALSSGAINVFAHAGDF